MLCELWMFGVTLHDQPAMKPAQTQAALTGKNDPVLSKAKNKWRPRTTQAQDHLVNRQRGEEPQRAEPQGGARLIKSLEFIHGCTYSIHSS